MTDEPNADTPRVITLDQLLKHRNAVGSGGEAKFVIQSGAVVVNGAVETRRRRKLRRGDVVEFEGERFEVDETEAD